MAIKEGIPNLLNLLKDKHHARIRKAAVLAVAEFSKQCKISFLSSVPQLCLN
jgi:hypothetical protein